jgi:hypothetical protein
VNRLTFNREDVQNILAHAESSPKWKAAYGDLSTVKPGIWFVCDVGVYLMSNGDPGQPWVGGPHKLFCAFAEEANPYTVGMDEVWKVRDAFEMHDDTCEFLPVDFIEEMLRVGSETQVAIEVTEEELLPTSPN